MKKILNKNRRARHEYKILEEIEVGIVLTGTEVKSIRLGKVNLAEGWIKINTEAKLMQTHISPYAQGNLNNHDPYRPRNLLLHKRELKRLRVQVQQKGVTLVPLQMHLRGQYVKLLIGLGRGKKEHDKRATAQEKQAQRDISRSLKRNV